jgi:hypothetical protein
METSGVPVFIVGSGRSGTTLLMVMMASHPDLAVVPESHFLPRLIREVPERLESPADVERMTAMVGGSEWFGGWDIDIADIEEAISRDLPMSRSDAIRTMYGCYAAALGKSRWGDKTPAYVYNLSVVAAELPEAKFIHLVRDGRNVALSFFDAPFGPDDLGEAALHWKLRVQRGRRDGRVLGEDRYLEVHYERLVADPPRELKRICAFVDLPYTAEMLEYPERASKDVPSVPWAENVRRAPTTTRDWRDQLTAQEQGLFGVLAGGTLRDFGYPAGARPGLGGLVGGGVAWLRWTTRRVLAKVRRGG